MSRPEFVSVTSIATTPDKLWQALTSSEFSKAYWFGTLAIPLSALGTKGL